MASVAGNDALADQQILSRMSQEAGGFDPDEIHWIIVWHAAGPDSTVPAACVSLAEAPAGPNTQSVGVSDGGTAGACNIYILPQNPGGAFEWPTATCRTDPDYYFGCSGPSDGGAGHKVDCRWPAQNRRRSSPRGSCPAGCRVVSPPPRLPGDHVRVEHHYLSGILGATRDITDNSINLLEPSNFGVNT